MRLFVGLVVALVVVTVSGTACSWNEVWGSSYSVADVVGKSMEGSGDVYHAHQHTPSSPLVLRNQHIAVVTSALEGQQKGGLAAAMTRLAYALRDGGAFVTILDVSSNGGAHSSLEESLWTSLRAVGIDYQTIPHNSGQWLSTDKATTSARVLEWLRNREAGCKFDQVHFHDFNGIGFHALEAASRGLALEGVKTVIHAHMNHDLLTSAVGMERRSEDDVTVAMERESLRLADEVIFPSAFYKNWVAKEWGLELSSATVLRNVPARVHSMPADVDPRTPSKVLRGESTGKVLAFFSRLSESKGLHTFVDAVSELVNQLKDAPEAERIGYVLFVGPMDVEGASDLYIRSHCAEWSSAGITCRIEENMATDQAVSFMRDMGAVVAAPSKFELAPYAVLEAASAGLPVVASRVGGTESMLSHKNALPANVHLVNAGSVKDLVSGIRAAMSMDKSAISAGLSHMTACADEATRNWQSRFTTWVSDPVSTPSRPALAVVVADMESTKEAAEALVAALAGPVTNVAQPAGVDVHVYVASEAIASLTEAAVGDAPIGVALIPSGDETLVAAAVLELDSVTAGGVDALAAHTDVAMKAVTSILTRGVLMNTRDAVVVTLALASRTAEVVVRSDARRDIIRGSPSAVSTSSTFLSSFIVDVMITEEAVLANIEEASTGMSTTAGGALVVNSPLPVAVIAHGSVSHAHSNPHAVHASMHGDITRGFTARLLAADSRYVPIDERYITADTPRVTLVAPTSFNDNWVLVTALLDRPVTGFDATDFTITGTGSPTTRNFNCANDTVCTIEVGGFSAGVDTSTVEVQVPSGAFYAVSDIYCNLYSNKLTMDFADNTAPVPTLLGPTDGSTGVMTWAVGANFNLKATFDDDISNACVTTGSSCTPAGATLATGNMKEATIPVQLPSSLKPGALTLSLTVVDYNSNQMTYTTGAWYFPGSSPFAVSTITVLGPVEHYGPSVNSTITYLTRFTGDVSDLTDATLVAAVTVTGLTNLAVESRNPGSTITSLYVRGTPSLADATITAPSSRTTYTSNPTVGDGNAVTVPFVNSNPSVGSADSLPANVQIPSAAQSTALTVTYSVFDYNEALDTENRVSWTTQKKPFSGVGAAGTSTGSVSSTSRAITTSGSDYVHAATFDVDAGFEYVFNVDVTDSTSGSTSGTYTRAFPKIGFTDATTNLECKLNSNCTVVYSFDGPAGTQVTLDISGYKLGTSFEATATGEKMFLIPDTAAGVSQGPVVITATFNLADGTGATLTQAFEMTLLAADAAEWVEGGFGGCSQTSTASCAGTQVQTVTCERAGAQVADLLCSLSAEKPLTTKDCVISGCSTPYYQVGEWSGCSASCRTSGQPAPTRSRTNLCCDTSNVCVTSTAICDTASVPTESTSMTCNDFLCSSYTWEGTGSYTACSAECGSGTQEEIIQCRDLTYNTIVDNVFCTTSPPVNSRACNTDPCPSFLTSVGQPGLCLDSSDNVLSCAAGQAGTITGTKTRNDKCLDVNDNFAEVAVSNCGLTAGANPLLAPATTSCSLTCEFYSYSVPEFSTTCPCGTTITRTRSCVDSSGNTVADSLCPPCTSTGCLASFGTTKDCGQCNFCDLNSNSACSGAGTCNRVTEQCDCDTGFSGTVCETAPSCTSGFLMEDGSCCSGVIAPDKSCCTSGVTDENDQCCASGNLDVCNVCDGTALYQDVNFDCCTIIDASGLCCPSGVLDSCGVCDGDGSSCGARIKLDYVGTSCTFDVANALKDYFENTAGATVTIVVYCDGVRQNFDSTGRLLSVTNVDEEELVFEAGARQLSTVSVGVDVVATPKATTTVAVSKVTPAEMKTVAEANTGVTVATPNVTPSGVCGNDKCETNERCNAVNPVACCPEDCPYPVQSCPTDSSGNECSSRGVCIPQLGASLGACTSCRDGFSGTACDVCASPKIVSGGKCVFTASAGCSDGQQGPGEEGSDCGGVCSKECPGDDSVSVLLVLGIIFLCIFVILVCFGCFIAFRRRDRRTKKRGSRRSLGTTAAPMASPTLVEPASPAPTRKHDPYAPAGATYGARATASATPSDDGITDLDMGGDDELAFNEGGVDV